MPIAALPTLLFAIAMHPQARAQDDGPHIPFFKTTLENGLQVVVHEDHSDPVVAVYVSYHVGSGREERGRSGFAHLFEHMLFQGSEHVGDDQHFKYVSEAGGTLNGTTNQDRTLYYETLPANQLEVALWLEADRMGFLLPAMTQEKLDNQRDVVRNERRQNYENRPYGQAAGVLAAAMFPPEHPYSWLTIGSHADLEAATLDDVHGFFRRWYGPNNATLVIAGDVDRDGAMSLVQKYFGPIPRGPQVDPPAPQPARLDAPKRLVMEDDVKLPQLSISWPGTQHFSSDDAALDMLAMVLSENRSSVLDRALTIDALLAQRVSARNTSGEIAGTFDVTVLAAPGVELDTLEREVHRLLEELAEKGVDATQLDRLKRRFESDFVRNLETVSARATALAEYNTFQGQPDGFRAELDAHLAVTPEQVRSVLRRTLVQRPCVTLSVVPRGKRGLAASGRTSAQIAAEKAFDRAAKPAANATPAFHAPAIWHGSLANGVKVTGTPFAELPVTTLTLSLPAGRLHETPDTLGLSSLCAAMMTEGTAKLSTTEFADALDMLGANINVSSDEDEISVTLSVLDKYLDDAMKLFADVVLEPRFDPADFERLKKQRLARIDSRGDNIRGIAETAWRRLMYGGDSIEGLPAEGTHRTIEGLKLSDVVAHHRRALESAGARMILVSGMDEAGLRRVTADLCAHWNPAPVASAAAVEAKAPAARPGTRLYLIDKPGAAQSEVRIGHMSVSSNDADHWPLTVLNHALGGAFTSRINLTLREKKGYTYGARSTFQGGPRPAPFVASAGVFSDKSSASVTEFLNEIRGILDGLKPDELEFTKSSLTQAQLRQYESARARLAVADAISFNGWPDDYLEQRTRILEGLDVEGLQRLARAHIDPEHLTILVVGDKAKIGDSLAQLGLGAVTELDIDGVPVP